MRIRDRKNNMLKANKQVLGILKEEDGGGESKKEKKTTLTRHPAYSAIDMLETELEKLKINFKENIANAVSGSDGYHSEIDKFSEDFVGFHGFERLGSGADEILPLKKPLLDPRWLLFHGFSWISYGAKIRC